MNKKRSSAKQPERRSIPIWVAIFVGLLWVNGPVLPLMLGTPILVLILVGKVPTGSLAIGIVVAAFIAGFVVAWSWWALMVPKWRLWAYERVEDVLKLKALAAAVGLTWPDGHIFERTEIRSAEHTAKERELDGRRR